MKKIMLILISAVMLFTACEKSLPQQIDPSEEFGGIMFGMTQEEVRNALSKEPDADYDETESMIIGFDKTFFNVSNASIAYFLTTTANFIAFLWIILIQNKYLVIMLL